MEALIVYIVTVAAWAHVMRFGQSTRRNINWVGAINFATALALSGGWWIMRPDAHLGWQEPVYGMIAGATGCAGYFLFNSGLRLAGVAITQSMGRLSVAVPVAAAIVIWGEIPGAMRAIGLALALTSVPLLAQGDALRNAEKSARKVPILLMHFVAMGVMGVAFKAYRESVPEGAGPVFLTFTYGVAAVCSVGIAAARSGRPDKRDIVTGLVLGAINLGSKFALMVALVALPAIVVFPVSTTGILILSTAAAMILWQERYRARAILGLVLALLALILISL